MSLNGPDPVSFGPTQCYLGHDKVADDVAVDAPLRRVACARDPVWKASDQTGGSGRWSLRQWSGTAGGGGAREGLSAERLNVDGSLPVCVCASCSRTSYG